MSAWLLLHLLTVIVQMSPPPHAAFPDLAPTTPSFCSPLAPSTQHAVYLYTYPVLCVYVSPTDVSPMRAKIFFWLVLCCVPGPRTVPGTQQALNECLKNKQMGVCVIPVPLDHLTWPHPGPGPQPLPVMTKDRLASLESSYPCWLLSLGKLASPGPGHVGRTSGDPEGGLVALGGPAKLVLRAA